MEYLLGGLLALSMGANVYIFFLYSGSIKELAIIGKSTDVIDYNNFKENDLSRSEIEKEEKDGIVDMMGKPLNEVVKLIQKRNDAKKK